MADPRAAYNKPTTPYTRGEDQQGQPKPGAPQAPVKKEIQISSQTKERAEAAKDYIESI